MSKASKFNMVTIQWINRILVVHLLVFIIAQFWTNYIILGATDPFLFLMPIFYSIFLILLISRPNARKMIQVITSFGIIYIMMPLAGLALALEYGTIIGPYTWFFVWWGIAAGLVSLVFYGKYAFAPKLKKF